MAEIHKRAIDGNIVSGLDADDLVDKHLNAPFAYPTLRADLRRAAIRAVRRYVEENRTRLENTLYSEQQIQVRVAPGITVDGRIDLITRLDTGETSIVDFKSTERAQAEEITRDQLHVYAVGYQELTGRRADVLEVLNLDEKGQTTRELVNDSLLTDIKGKIAAAGEDLRANRLPRLASWCSTCESCDLAGLCQDTPLSVMGHPRITQQCRLPVPGSVGGDEDSPAAYGVDQALVLEDLQGLLHGAVSDPVGLLQRADRGQRTVLRVGAILDVASQ